MSRLPVDPPPPARLTVDADQRWRRTLAAADRAALRALARGRPLENVLNIVCNALEQLIDDAACSVLLLTPDRRRLVHGAAPRLPQTYIAAINDAEIGPTVGSCGTAAYFGRQVIVEDIRSSPLWVDFRDAADAAGLRACWSTPIRSPNGEVLGTFAVYFHQPRGPLRRDLRTVAHMATLAAVAIARRRAEDALLEAKARAEDANTAKTTFLAGMSHELRTPLNAIIGFAEIMATEMHGPVGSPRYLDYAKIIATSGRHLLTLIDDLLDLSKLEAGRMTLMREPVDLALVLRDALSMAGQPGPADAPAIVADLTAGPLVVEADRRALVQVLINLIGNATKFTGGDGRVTVRLLLTRDGRPGFEVTDTGIGIPADRLADLCRPFVQIENIYSRERRGTGMGLYISRSLVDLHGGSFEIESREMVGTTVRVLLPADRLVTAQRRENDASASSGANI